MPSPFPGMDPYVEDFWGDFHHNFITYARDQMQPFLPGDLRARVNERVFVEPAGECRPIYPDLAYVERARTRELRARSASAVAVTEPLTIHLDGPRTQGFIEIIEVRSGRRVITIVELLSPANKAPGEGRTLYLKKQRQVLASDVSLVEIDLLRTGRWTVGIPQAKVPIDHRTPYRVVIRRGWDLLEAKLYAIPLQVKLPTIRVPLRETDQEVPLDLQALFDQCYRRGDYDGDIDYRQPLQPPMKEKDAQWVDGLLGRKRPRAGAKKKTP